MPPLDSEGKAPESLPDDQWKTWTWKQHYDESRKAAKGFLEQLLIDIKRSYPNNLVCPVISDEIQQIPIRNDVPS